MDRDSNRRGCGGFVVYIMSKLELMIDVIDTMLDGRRRTDVELSYKYGGQVRFIEIFHSFLCFYLS